MMRMSVCARALVLGKAGLVRRPGLATVGLPFSCAVVKLESVCASSPAATAWRTGARAQEGYRRGAFGEGLDDAQGRAAVRPLAGPDHGARPEAHGAAQLRRRAAVSIARNALWKRD